MRIQVKGFGGVRPRVDPQFLENYQATEALNCKLWAGNLKPYQSLLTVPFTLFKKDSGVIDSLFRFNVQPSDADTAGFFFHWLGIAHAIRGLVPGDNLWTTVITGDGLAPRITDNTMQTGPDYPSVWETLGVPVPDTSGSTATVTGTPDVGSDPLRDAVRRDYVIAYVNSRGQLGPTSNVIRPDADWLPGQEIDLAGLPVSVGGGFNITSKRIYRLGAAGTTRYFVAEIAMATATFTDDVDELALGEAAVSAGWEMPPATMHSIGAMSNGIAYGAFRNQVCVCVPWHVHAWDPLNRQTLNYDIVGMGSYGTTIVALTGENPHLLYGNDPGDLAQQELKIGQGCLSNQGIVSASFGVAYPSKDGLVLINDGGAQIMTMAFYTRDEWKLLAPETFKGALYADRYFAFYDTGAVQGGLIIDPQSADAGVVFTDVAGTAVYSDPVARALYIVQGGVLKQWDAGPTLLTYKWRSKEFVFDYYIALHWGRVLADSYANLQVEFWVDDVLTDTVAITSRAPFPLPGTEGLKGRKFQFRLTGTDTVTEAAFVSSQKELR